MRRLIRVTGILFLTAVALFVGSYVRNIRAARERVATGSLLAETTCGRDCSTTRP